MKLKTFNLILLALLTFVSCSNETKEIQYEEVKVEERTLVRSFETSGSIEYKKLVEIMAPVEGRLEKILVEEGEKVEKGQVVAIMSSTLRVKMIDSAMHVGKKEKDFWEKQLLPTKVYTPTSGEVYDRKLGELDFANNGIMRISTGKVVRANVDEIDLNKIKINQSVSISLDVASDKKINGIISKISQTSKKVSNVNVYEVEIELASDAKEKIGFDPKYGMSVTIEFPIEKYEHALALPARAVDSNFGTKVKLTKSTGQRIDVELGNLFGDYVHVKSGLAKGDVILIEKFSNKQKSKRQSPLMMLVK
ncbi:MAG: HlyD family efflux transporter periplasmic adaptor subunit [Bdellovibrionota bacterium]